MARISGGEPIEDDVENRGRDSMIEEILGIGRSIDKTVSGGAFSSLDIT